MALQLDDWFDKYGAHTDRDYSGGSYTMACKKKKKFAST